MHSPKEGCISGMLIGITIFFVTISLEDHLDCLDHQNHHI